MGAVTYVEVGDRIVASRQVYRDRPMDLPRFLFTLSDLKVELGSDGVPTELAFETTGSKVLQNLEEQGLGWHASVAAYATVRDGLFSEEDLIAQWFSEIYSEMRGDFAINKVNQRAVDSLFEKTEARLGAQRAVTPEGDLSSLGMILAAQWLDPSREKILLLSDLNDEPMTESRVIIGQAIRAAQEAARPPLPIARAVETLARLFREARLVAWPMIVAVLLKHLPVDTRIRYVLHEKNERFGFAGSEEANKFVDDYWKKTGEAIADYARNVGVLFGALSNFENRLGPPYWFGQAAAALDQLDELNKNRVASTAKARGDVLERLVESLLMTEAPHLTITEKNFSTREEEIDLVLRNNLPDPFWVSQHSPYMFVECKNWGSPVGVAELRAFESKIDDRKSVVKIGIFVSSVGFYKTFVERLKAIQTKGIGLVYAVTLDDIRGLIDRRERLSDWLLGMGAMRAFDADVRADHSP